MDFWFGPEPDQAEVVPVPAHTLDPASGGDSLTESYWKVFSVFSEEGKQRPAGRTRTLRFLSVSHRAESR